MTTNPPIVTTYNKAIKVTVDGPREPRSKIRHPAFASFPSFVTGRHFTQDNLSFGLPLKLNGNLCILNLNRFEKVDVFYSYINPKLTHINFATPCITSRAMKYLFFGSEEAVAN